MPVAQSSLRELEAPLVCSAMHRRYGLFLQYIFKRFFRPISYADRNLEELRHLTTLGTVVHIARGRSHWLALYFNYLLNAANLPLAAFVGGANVALLQPWDHLWRVWRQRRRRDYLSQLQTVLDAPSLTADETLLAATAARGDSAFVILRPPHDKISPADRNDYIRSLVVAQRHSPAPIFLVPHVFTDRNHSGGASVGLTDRLFGDKRRPGTLRQLVMLMLPAQRYMIRSGDTLNLQEFCAEHEGCDDLLMSRKVRHEINRRMNEEERVVAGPELTPFAVTARHVMRNPIVKDTVAKTATQSGKSQKALENQAGNHLRHIAARYRVGFIRFLAHVLNLVFNRIYDGIALDETGLKQVIEASRHGPLLFCPSHRSHIDYLVLSYALWQRGIAPPHIAAGANLAFFPLGPIFRGSGAFFLRRTFREDALYASVFRSYVQELVKTGTSIEFFLEGTRSRTGKLLMPKFGILSMVVDAWRRGAREDVQIVPVSIDYDRIIEAGAYQAELHGAEKKAEDIGGLLRSTGVLRSRYGRVYVQFGDPLSLKEMAESKQLPQDEGEENDARWRNEIERLGYRILHQVAMIGSVTPTAVVAAALLGHSGRGMPQGILLGRCQGIIEFLEAAPARLANLLQQPDARAAAVLEAVQKLVDEGLVAVDRAGRSDIEPIYRVHDDRRVVLDFHKNSIMNYFAPVALIARAMVKRGESTVNYQELHDDTRFLSRLFKREFIYRVDSDFETYFDETLAIMAARGLLDVVDNQQVHVRDEETLRLLAGLLDNFVQAYWVTATTLLDLRAFPLWQKELLTRSMERARRSFLEGNISRPEAASRTLIEAALSWMKEYEVVFAKNEGKRTTLGLSQHYAAGGLQQLINDIAAFL